MSAWDENRPALRARTTRRTFLVLAGVAAVGATASCAGGGTPNGRGAATRAPESRQVWAHMVPQGLPLILSDDIHYGSERPLSYAPSDARYEDQIAGQLDQARASGLTGMQILLLEGINTGKDFVGDWMSAADASWDDPGAQGFAVAPCLQISSLQGAVEMVEQYAETAAAHPSAARSEQALVIWVYNARSLAPDEWDSFRQTMQDKDTDLFVVAELETAASQHGDALDTTIIDPYSHSFDAVWLFDDQQSAILTDFTTWAAKNNLPFMGGALPGYDRETDHGGYLDARGTDVWRAQLQEHLESRATWLSAVTWNDAVEHTSVEPSTDWGTTRADLLAHYSAIFRGVDQKDTEASAYVTTPQFLVAGQELLAEGLVINHGSHPVKLQIRVVSAKGETLATATSPRVAPGGLAAAVVERELDVRGGDHLHAVVDLLDDSGARVNSTRGAPVIVFDTGDPAIPAPSRRRYYSLCSTATADFAELADIDRGGKNAAAPSGIRMKPGVSARSVEFLHNTWPAGLALDSTTLTYAPPTADIVGGQEVSTPSHGFTVARAITDDGRIAYSTPIHHRQS